MLKSIMEIHFFKNILKIFVLFLLSSNLLYAINITADAEFLIDTNNSLTLIEIKDNTNVEFTHINSETLNLGFSNSTVWLRIKVENKSNKPIREYLVYKDPIVGELDIFFKDRVEYFGVLRKHTSAYIHPTFGFELEPKEQAYIYAKVFSNVTPINIKLHIYNEHELNKSELTNHLVMAMFFGFLIALIVYNISVYFSIKNKVFLFYIFYVFAILVHHLGYKGFQQLYIAPDSLPYILTHPVAIMDAMMLTGMVLFTGSFLHVKRYKKIYIIFHIIAIGSILNAILMLYAPFYNLEIVFLWAIIGLITIFFSAVYLMFNGVNEAKIYLLGWFPLTLMFTLVVIRQLFGINILSYLPYFEEFAISFEATIFSVALSLRIKRIDKEKHEAVDRLLEFEQNAKQKLRIEVDEKTKELTRHLKEKEILLRELNHRVKNNMQIIISMLRLQAKKYGKHEQEIVQVAENRIRSMLFIHELLYEKGEKVSLEPKEYFTLLVEKINDSFSIKNESVTLEIENLEFDTDRVVNLGFIINELLTNAIKHAKPEKELHIKLALHKTQNEVVLTFSDNGTSLNEPKSGLGTLFIDSMVKEQLKGRIQRRFDDGYKIDITIPDKKVMQK